MLTRLLGCSKGQFFNFRVCYMYCHSTPMLFFVSFAFKNLILPLFLFSCN
jgi:hypothetical protein